MLKEILLREFKAHERTRLPLGRFTVLVGDNASGKTSVLEALSLQAALNPNPVSVLVGDRLPDDLLRRGASGPIELTSRGVRDGQPWTANIKLNLLADATRLPDDESEDGRGWELNLEGSLGTVKFSGHASGHGTGGTSGEGWNNLARTIGEARIYRLRSDVVAAAAYSMRPVTRVGINGAHTAVALANMKLGNDEVFERVEGAMRRLVPSLERIRIHPATVKVPDGRSVVGSKLYFDFRGARNVPAHNASEGTLIVLALLTVFFGLRCPDLILLDDFDHALHPRAQMELVRMLKELLELDEFRDLQVVATTHSPYTLDEIAADDVHVFALREDGTVASKRLSEHPEAKRTKGSLRAGQLWSLDSEREWVLRDHAA